MTKLVLRNITKKFGGYTAVDNLNLTLNDGELVSLLGSSGCGKTTTLRMIAGFVTPTEGTIELDGKVISSPQSSLPPEKREMAMIFQSYAIWPNMTVEENVAYGLKLRKVPADESKRRVAQMLDVVQLGPLRDRYPAELSGGQQQRVSLARSMVVKPSILLLDEPLSNLDANLREEMRFEIRRLHDKYRYTTVYVTHDQAEAMTTADLIVVMNQGVIEQAGSPEDIYQRPRTEFVAHFIGGTNVLRGRWDGADAVACGNGLVLRCASGEFGSGATTGVSVRHHDVRLSAAKPDAETNVVQGTVARQIYLGSHRDYLVTLPDGETVRVVTPSSLSIPPGQGVWLHLPPEHCRALAH